MASPKTSSEEERLRCQWTGCTQIFVEGDDLYAHLCNHHVGRKALNNLCLTCQWNGCNVSCTKRDHITSHLRVHIPLKPHTCQVCDKTFKRPQDLKKHEKIHTEEHHVHHKHSKAITVSDPIFSARVAPPGSAASAQRKISASSTPSTSAYLLDHPRHSGTPSSADEARTPGDGDRRTRSPTSQWDVESLLDYRPTSSNKRAYDDGAANAAVDGFFRDMKKRKYAPTYDAQMVEQLSALSTIAYDGHRIAQEGFPGSTHTPAQFNTDEYGMPSSTDLSHMANTLPNINPAMSMASMFAPSQQTINPFAALSLPSQALPRTAEELAIVNKFLVRLGQTIAAQNTQPPLDPNGSFTRAVPNSFPGNLGHTPLAPQQHHHQLYDANPYGALGLNNNTHEQHGRSLWASTSEDTATMASLGLPPTATQMYGYASALAGLPREGQRGNAQATLSSGLGSSLYPLGDVLPSPGRSRPRSGSPSDVDGTILGQEKSVSPLIQPAQSSSSSVASGYSTSNPRPKADDQLSQGASTPAEQPVDPFANVPTTTEVRRGLSDVPQLASIDTIPGLTVRQQIVPLQTAPPMNIPGRAPIKTEEIGDEEVDELADDDDEDGDELMASASTVPSPTPTPPPALFPTSSARSSLDMSLSHFPLRTPPRPLSSSGPMYPRITQSPSPPRERETKVTLPSAASLISRADELANERRRHSQTHRSQYSASHLPSIGSRIPSRPPPSLMQRHLALVDALLQWVNTEFLRIHERPQGGVELERPEWKSGGLEDEEEYAGPMDDDYESDDDDELQEMVSPVSFPLRAVARDVEMVSVA